jgi:hypothetical protein
MVKWHPVDTVWFSGQMAEWLNDVASNIWQALRGGPRGSGGTLRTSRGIGSRDDASGGAAELGLHRRCAVAPQREAGAYTRPIFGST